MRLFRFYHNLKQFDRRTAVTIGSFDGMHRGHQAILNHLKARAAKDNLQSVVILFEPQPKEYFSPILTPPRIMRLEDKLLYLAQEGIDAVVCLRFNEHLASLSATHFVEEVLINRLNLAYLVIGEDFHFGSKRLGDVEFLRRIGAVNHFEVDVADHLMEGSERVSSTLVRQALNQGDYSQARELLGHPIFLSGRVIRGNHRGRELGFPTLNIRLNRTMALKGVSAVKTYWDGQIYNGVANIGCRPTFGCSPQFLEVHLFDFHKDLYGQRVHVEFIQKVRDEMRFDSMPLLQAQIQKDIEVAKGMLN